MIAIIGALLLLAACASKGGVLTLQGGACKAFEAPQYEVAGRNKHDQNWIDDQIEAGVGACEWQRPKPRPRSWDAPRPKVVAPAHSAPAVISDTPPIADQPPPQQPKKKRIRDRIRELLAH